MIFKFHTHSALNKTLLSKNPSGNKILNSKYKTLWPESKKTVIVTIFYLYSLRNLAKKEKAAPYSKNIKITQTYLHRNMKSCY